MNNRRSSTIPSRVDWIRSGLMAVSLTLLSSPFATVHADMIGTGSVPRAVVMSDVNEDGYADLISGNDGDSTVSVSLGRGNGTFHPKVQYSCGSSVYAIDLFDLNGDNHLDMVSCCPNIGRIGVRFGAGDGTFGGRTDYLVNSPIAVVARDLNQDNLPDLAVVSSGSPFLTIMTATGAGVYGPQVTYPGANSSAVAVGQLNNDNRLDLVTSNTSGTGVQVYLSTATPGVYGPPVSYSMQGPTSSVSLVDLNHDGTLDIAAAIPSFGTVNVRLGVGDGTFAASSTYVTGTSPSAIASADFNGDTHPDLAVTANGGSAVSVLLGTGTGSFQPKVDYPAGVGPLGVALGQLDGNASFDLAIAASGSNSVCTLFGNGNGTFQIPSGPVYVWANASGSAFDPSAWLPARGSGTASDILVFNRGGAATVSNVPSASIGQMVVSGGTQASFSGLFGAVTLTIAGGAGDDVLVEEGSRAILATSGTPVTVNVAVGATARINGDVEIRGGANRFQALDPNGIVFQSTGRAFIGAGSSSTPFGNGTGGSGLNSVLFHYGSMFIAQAPVSVFGATAPNAVVVFWPGSRFRMDVAFTPETSGRTYADFEYNVPAGSTTIAGGGSFQVDSLIVKQGAFTVAMTGAVNIRGNIVIAACAGPNQLVFAPPTPTIYRMNGSSRQLVYSTAMCLGNALRIYASPNVTFNIDNPAGVYLSQGWRTSANLNFTRGNIGNLYGWQLVADSTSTLTGASQSTGWVETQLTRRVTTNGPVHFDVGDSANYLPMDVVVNGVTTPGYVLAGMYAGNHSDIGGAQLDLSHLVHRTWVLTASNDFGNVQVPTFFSALDATFPFLPSDVDPGSDPLLFVMRQHFASGFPWRGTTAGLRTATSTQALGLTASAVDSFDTFAAGQPITPSLSLVAAVSAEGNPAALGLDLSDGKSATSQMLRASPVQPTDLVGIETAEIVPPSRVVVKRGLTLPVAMRPMRVQSPGSLSFRVRLSQAAVVPISVGYETVDGTATLASGDYSPTSGTMNFAPGDTAQDIVVALGGDPTPERNETITMVLSNPVNATIANGTVSGTILDDDDLISPTAQVISPNGGETIYQNQQVNLQWTAADNVAVSGVDIQILNGGSLTTLASNHPNTGTYLWIASGPASTKMKFRVVAHDDPGHATTDNSDANWVLSPLTVGVEVDAPLAFALPSPSPNPSTVGDTQIAFAVPRESPIRLTVYDVRGRRVSTLAEGTVPAGQHVRSWDCSGVAAGVYFVRFEAPGFHAERRLVVVR